jgi:hypothetical protein
VGTVRSTPRHTCSSRRRGYSRGRRRRRGDSRSSRSEWPLLSLACEVRYYHIFVLQQFLRSLASSALKSSASSGREDNGGEHKIFGCRLNVPWVVLSMLSFLGYAVRENFPKYLPDGLGTSDLNNIYISVVRGGAPIRFRLFS